MKNISKEEFEKLVGSDGGVSAFASMFKNMAIDECLVITKDEWKLKSTPIVYLGNYKKRSILEWKSKRLPDGSGWAIMRIK